MNESIESSRDYLKEPYSRILTPDDETGTYTAEIREFPGCVAQGNTIEEAYKNLEVAAESWIEVSLGMGQEIPAPAQEESYSGRVAFRLPKSLHRRAAQAAERNGTSLNQFLVAAVAEQLGAEKLCEQLAERSEQQLRYVQAAEQRAIGLMRNTVGWFGNFETPSLSPLSFAGGGIIRLQQGTPEPEQSGAAVGRGKSNMSLKQPSPSS